MKTGITLAILALAAGAGVANEGSAITGEYIEARTCDVWTGPCFANGEINLIGKQAVAAWIVTRGSWAGTSLDGLKVVAAISAEGTLHTSGEGKVEAVLMVDEKATAEQAKALVAMAKSLAPQHLANVVKIERRAIAYSRKGLEAELSAGEDARIKTTAFCPCDAICCNEEKAYPSIGDAKVECAKTLEHAYRGAGLGGTWSDPVKRSAMIGTFTR